MKLLPEAEIAIAAVEGISVVPQLGIAESAAALAPLLATGDVIVAAVDEARAAALGRALAVAVPGAQIVICPGSDALPGDSAPSSPANVGQRVSALRILRRLGDAATRPPCALITTGEALARAYPPPADFDAEPPSVALGDAVDLVALNDTLLGIGYIADERVDEPGEVALRGQVLDVFPADASLPLRIEVADGRIAAIRRYDPVDQRSTEEIERRELGRVTEPALGAERTILLDHLPGATVVIGAAADERRRRLLLLVADAVARGSRRARTDVIDDATWRSTLATRDIVTLGREGDPPPRFVEGGAPLRAFAKIARAAVAAGDRIVLLGGERDLRFLTTRVANVLKTEAQVASDWADVAAAPPGSLLTLALPAERGFRRAGVLAVAAADLIGSRAVRDDARMPSVAPAFDQATEIRIGDVVIHEDHGIATVAGLEALPEADGGGDAIRLTHADDAVRLVPVAEADRLWRYGAEEDAVRLDTLDGASWHKRRGAIDVAIAESARQLTDLAAQRAERTAPVLDPDPAAYERFAAGFPFSETPDQLSAIEAIRSDLSSGRPMDRLIVGDVGFGKTEVALRAVALAALSGRQVAVAAPTTVLARQHLDVFSARFEGTDVVVAGLSRLSSATEKRRVKAGLADGSIHVVVGTGAVAGAGIEYKELALVVIDEEQRFGVADKQRLQDLSQGHVLTLSATPIPRTLQSAMVGLRQLSIIATPPARRQPIRTAVSAFVPETLRAALLHERSRGGQSFVVVPRIADMAPLAKTLATLVPELDVREAHGKLPAAEIDEAMVGFARGDADILLATNIIEAGLDVPRANTMAILHADRFGLSQLHQLRGRVGRGNRRGQVLLFTQGEDSIAPRTLKRLRTLEAFDRLGAGFAISARDLDLRGAGDLVGDTQAGHMRLIGVELYQQLLEGALREIRGESADRWTPILQSGVAGDLPEDWIPEADMRVSLYARLARIDADSDLDAFEMELEDRFGAIPDTASRLLAIARIRLKMRAAGIARIDAGPAAIAVTLRPGAKAPPASLDLREKSGRWLLAERIEDPHHRLVRVDALLDEWSDG
jgi:transcription-repair coupling factor (superfamily II helicase)